MSDEKFRDRKPTPPGDENADLRNLFSDDLVDHGGRREPDPDEKFTVAAGEGVTICRPEKK